ncbi:hypothetical protein D3C74_272740 [compost metagenome]
MVRAQYPVVMTEPATPAQVYDDLALGYDDMYASQECIDEDQLLAHLLLPLVQDADLIIDVGCGTGLALDLWTIEPGHYVGVDPSARMVGVAKEKHPQHLFEVSTFEPWTRLQTNDLVLGLYGVGSYLNDDQLRQIIRGPHALMFYAEGYLPAYYRDGREPFLGRQGLPEALRGHEHVEPFGAHGQYLLASRAVA